MKMETRLTSTCIFVLWTFVSALLFRATSCDFIDSDADYDNDFERPFQFQRLSTASSSTSTTTVRSNNIFSPQPEQQLTQNPTIECKVTKISSFPDPSSSFPPLPKWFCIQENMVDRNMYLLKGDIESFFAIKGFILDRYLRLQIPISWLVSINSSNISRSSGAAAIRTSIGMGSDLDDSDALSIDLNSNDASSHIQVIQGTSTTHEESLHDRGLQGKGGGDDYEYEFESHYFHGTYRVLIIRVQDKFGNEVNQSEEQLHNDFFTDENNLKSRYLDCSNNQLNFIETTGYNVNNGVVTITLSINVADKPWYTVADRAFRIVNNMAGINRADYGIFVLPNIVDFEGALAYGDFPGIFTYFKSAAASIPTIQVHEMGHNLFFDHSGKEMYSQNWKNKIADQACSMGSPATGLDDEGLRMCFNGAKTWYTEWYDEYQLEVYPDIESFSGMFVGIDDIIKKNNISDDDHHVVIRIRALYEPDLFVIYQRKKGINGEIPEDGDSVVITEQEGGEGQSWWISALRAGESYEQDNWSYSNTWSNNRKTLVVKVCSMTMGSPDTAYVIIYLKGKTDITCPDVGHTEAPSPVPAPTKLITASPTKEKQNPTASPTKETQNPTPKPLKVTNIPTESQTTPEPTSTPREQPYAKFLLRKGKTITKSCTWLSTRSEKTKKKICRNKNFQAYSEELNKSPASLVCFETCADYCPLEVGNTKFIYNVLEYAYGSEVVVTKQCKWLNSQPRNIVEEICTQTLDADSIYGQANQVCTSTCDSCSSSKK